MYVIESVKNVYMADFSDDEAPLPSLEKILAERVDDVEVSRGELPIHSECVYVLFSSALVTSKQPAHLRYMPNNLAARFLCIFAKNYLVHSLAIDIKIFPVKAEIAFRKRRIQLINLACFVRIPTARTSKPKS